MAASVASGAAAGATWVRRGVILVVVLAVAFFIGNRVNASSDYELQIVMPAATNLVAGSPVQIDGETVGSVQDLEARDGKAVITVSVNDDHAPLPDGTRARISWKAVMGERIVDLLPGDGEVQLADGALVEGTVDRVELDQVLAALDEPTRAQVQTLVADLSSTLEGSEQNAQATLAAAGPTVEALAAVLQAVGTDGPALRTLVTRLTDLTGILAARDTELANSIDGLTTMATTLTARRSELASSIEQLPETLDVADSTLALVPSTVTAASPLLRDLQPAAALLPGISAQLDPLLADLRPTVAELGPTLTALDQLLVLTPGVFDQALSVVPQVDEVVEGAGPALTYLRPYMPELAGWLSNWGSASANYDADQRYLRAFVQEGTTSLNHMPVMPPGIERRTMRLPGEAEKQPWTDAHGSEMQ